MKKAKITKRTVTKKKGTANKVAVKMGSMQKGSAQKGASKGVTGAKAVAAKKGASAPSATSTRGSIATKNTTAGFVAKGPAVATKLVANGNGSKFSASKGTVPAPRGFVASTNSASCLFKVSEKVVYPAHGVGIIDSIEIRVVGGTEHKFYMITILETGMKIMVPLAQVDTVGLRRVVDEKTIEKVYDILRDRNVVVDTQTWNRRYREYTQKLKTGSLFEIAKVIRDLSVLRFDKELSFGERKMLDTAQGLLVKEISIAKSRPEDKIKQEILDFFHAA